MPIQSIGEAARGFASGFMQARMLKQQREMQALQQKADMADRLLQASREIQEPTMREAVYGQGLRLMQEVMGEAEGSSKKKSKSGGGGVGGFFSSLFGLGKKDEEGGAEAAAQPSALPQLERPPDVGPAAVSPGSQTFGDISEMLGPALARGGATTAPNVDAPAAAAKPGMMTQVELPKPPAMDEAAAAAMPNVAAASQTPAASPPTTARPQFQTALQLKQQARTATQSPKYGFRDEAKENAMAQQQAYELIEEMRGGLDAFLERTPAQETLDQALAMPEIGTVVRDAMNAMTQYEAEGYLPKGYKDDWLMATFPTDPRFGYKAPEAPKIATLEDKVAQNTATPEERAQYLANIEAKAKAGQTPSAQEQAYKAAYDEKIKRGVTPEVAHREMATAGQAPRDPHRQVIQTVNPATGLTEFALFTEGRPLQFIGQAPKSDFNPRTLMTQMPGSTTYGPDGTLIQRGGGLEFNPELILAALDRGDIDQKYAETLLGAIQDAPTKARLEQMLRNPFPRK